MTLAASPKSLSDRNRRETARKRILSSNMAMAAGVCSVMSRMASTQEMYPRLRLLRRNVEAIEPCQKSAIADNDQHLSCKSCEGRITMKAARELSCLTQCCAAVGLPPSQA